MYAQKLKIQQKKPFMSRKKLDNEQNIEQNKRIAGKKNRWKKKQNRLRPKDFHHAATQYSLTRYLESHLVLITHTQ